MPELFAGLEGIDRVLMSIAFVFIAAAISRWQHSDLEKDLAVAALRSFIQLIAIGYVLELVFEMDVPLFTIAILLVMITIGGRTSGARAKKTPNGVMVAFLAIGIGSGLDHRPAGGAGRIPVRAQGHHPHRRHDRRHLYDHRHPGHHPPEQRLL